MPRFATQFGCSLFALGFALLAAPLSAQDASPSPKPSATAKSDKKDKNKEKDKKDATPAKDAAPAKPAGDDQNVPADIPIPEGQPVKGLEFPSYDANGNLQMMLTAEVATKINPTHIDLQNMKIDATGDDGKKIHIEFPHSIFEINERVLTGDKGVLIRRDDFELTGDSGEFYTKTRFAKVYNNIKMILNSPPADTATPTPTPTPKPGTSAK